MRAQQKEKQRVDEYEKACALLDKKQSESGLEDALSIFEKLKDYRDSGEKLLLCQAALAEFREQELLREKLKRRDSLQGQKKNLEKELDGLGLFARKRKKEIAAELQIIDQEMTQIEKELE